VSRSAGFVAGECHAHLLAQLLGPLPVLTAPCLGALWVVAVWSITSPYAHTGFAAQFPCQSPSEGLAFILCLPVSSVSKVVGLIVKVLRTLSWHLHAAPFTRAMASRLCATMPQCSSSAAPSVTKTLK